MTVGKTGGLSLEIGKLSLDGQSTMNGGPHRSMTPLPSPVGAIFTQSSSDGGNRTRDFFGTSLSPSQRPIASWAALDPVSRQRTVSNESYTRSPLAKSVGSAVESLSSLPSAIQTSPPRPTKTGYPRLGLGQSPTRAGQRNSDPLGSLQDVPISSPSRLPSNALPPIATSLDYLSRDKTFPTDKERETSESPTAISFGDRIRCVDEHIQTHVGATLNDEYTIQRKLGDGAFSEVVLAERKRPFLEAPPSPRSLRRSKKETPHNLVAIKIIDNDTCAANDRMRISVLREIEVLKHIHHPSLVHLLDSFSTRQHTCLVLEYAAGGELFEILAKHHRQFEEGFVKRIFSELADVLGWMHGIGLVHRDIKLENILLTVNPFQDPATPLPSIIVKLTDFGLSRFIDLADPVLRTRCGSEEYAAPELIMGQPYDARQTDAWALGVVLYALLVGTLPFSQESMQNSLALSQSSQHSAQSPIRSRRSYLMQIAKADFTWPATNGLATPAARDVANRLLVRDAHTRASITDLWSMPWMSTGSGSLTRRRSQMKRNPDGTRSREGSRERARTLSQSLSRSLLGIDGLPFDGTHLSPVASPNPEEMEDGESSGEEDVVWVAPIPQADTFILHAESEPPV